MNVVKERVKTKTLPIDQIFHEELARTKLSKPALIQVSTANKARKYLIISLRKNEFGGFISVLFFKCSAAQSLTLPVACFTNHYIL